MHTIPQSKLAASMIQRHGYGEALAIVHNRAREMNDHVGESGYSESGAYERWADIKIEMITKPIYAPG